MILRKISRGRAALLGIGAFTFAALALVLHFRDDSALDPDAFPEISVRPAFSSEDEARFIAFDKASAGYRQNDDLDWENDVGEQPFHEWEYLLAEQPARLADVAANAALLPAAEALLAGPVTGNTGEEITQGSGRSNTLVLRRKAERIFSDAVFIAAQQGDFPRAYALLRRAEALNPRDDADLALIDLMMTSALSSLIQENLAVLIALDPDAARAQREGQAALQRGPMNIPEAQWLAGESRFFRSVAKTKTAFFSTKPLAMPASWDELKEQGDALHNRWLNQNYLPNSTANTLQKTYREYADGTPPVPAGWFARNVARNCGGRRIVELVPQSIDMVKFIPTREQAGRLRLAATLHRAAHGTLPPTLEALAPYGITPEEIADFRAAGGTYDPATGTITYLNASKRPVPRNLPDPAGARRHLEAKRQARIAAEIAAKAETDEDPEAAE